MLLQELKEQAFKLPPNDRIELAEALIASLQMTSVSQSNRHSSIQRMRGLLKTDQPAPTDQKIAEILEERRLEKYL